MEYKKKHVGGYKALDIMEKHLPNNLFLVNDNNSIADISLNANTHGANEGG